LTLYIDLGTTAAPMRRIDILRETIQQ